MFIKSLLKYRLLIMVGAFFGLAFGNVAAVHAAPPSATAFYERAVAAMQALPSLPNATYTIVARSDGGKVMTRRTKAGIMELYVGPGPSTKIERIAAAYRASDQMVTLTLKSGEHGVAPLGLLTPTWQGAFEFTRHGFDAPPTPAPSTLRSPAPIVAASPTPALPTIAVVRAFGAGFYRVTDRGAAKCPSGAPGHALHLIARSDPQAHPLTDVIVDLHSMRFCAMRFAVNRSFGGIFGGTGFIELSFSRSGEYWVERTTAINFEVRAVGIALKHVVMHLAYSGVSLTPSPSARQ